MLTTEALQDRKWGEFPELRKILATQPAPPDYYGPTSKSDNIFNRLHDLVEVAIIVRENQKIIEQRAAPENLEQLTADLNRLEAAVALGVQFFQDHTDSLRRLADDLRRRHQPK